MSIMDASLILFSWGQFDETSRVPVIYRRWIENGPAGFFFQFGLGVPMSQHQPPPQVTFEG